MEHVVNHLRKKNRNFRRNVSDVHIIKGMVIVFLLFFVISGILAFPIELFVKAIPKVLFSHFKKINELEAKIMFVVLDTVLSMIMFSLVDYFMKSVSATPISLFVVSLIMSLLCMNDVIEKKDR